MEELVLAVSYEEDNNPNSINDEELEYFYKLWEEDRL
jgi:hypothetical protein